MDSNSIAMLMMGWQDKIPQDSKLLLQEKLKEVSEDKMPILSAVQLKNSVIGLVLGLFLGGLGVDRFYKGDFLLGGIKLALVLLYFVCIGSATAAVVGGSLEFAGFLGGLAIFFLITLFIWCITDLFLVWRGIKRDNFNKIQNLLLTL